MKLYTLEEVIRIIRGCENETELINAYIEWIEKTEYFNPEQQKRMQKAYQTRLNQIQDNDVQY